MAHHSTKTMWFFREFHRRLELGPDGLFCGKPSYLWHFVARVEEEPRGYGVYTRRFDSSFSGSKAPWNKSDWVQNVAILYRFSMCDWRTFTAESSLVRENEAILYIKKQMGDCLDHLKWCSHLPDLPVIRLFLDLYLASFLNCDLLILFFFIQLYSKHVVDTSFDMQSFLSMSNEIYGRNDVYTSQLVKYWLLLLI